MFRIMLQKMWHKKWMNFCLLLGATLLVATVVSFPLYQNAAYNRMLHDELNNYITDTGKWPCTISLSNSSRKEPGGTTIQRLEEFTKDLYEDLEVTEKRTIFQYNILQTSATHTINMQNGSDFNICLGAMSDMENHIKLLTGDCYSELGVTEDGAIEVILTENGLVGKNLIVGETVELPTIKDAFDNPIRLYIKGVFKEDENTDFYWQMKIGRYYDIAFMNYDLFRSLFLGENAGRYNLNCLYYAQFEYDDLSYEQLDDIQDYSLYLEKESSYRKVIDSINYTDTFEKYLEKQKRIDATLVILQIPVLVMLAAFLFMISGQMYEMEKNEISVIKSRGSSGGQIFRLYLYQGLVITVFGGVLGLPIGALFSRVLGATRNFLEFDSSQYLNVVYTNAALIYALAGMLVILLSITLPAIKHSRISIVNLKQSKAVAKKPLWEKLFVDILLIALSVYGYYNFHKNMAEIKADVMMGASLDPFLYISSSLMIVGLGLFFLRIQPLIVKLIYNIGKKWWGPASHISFMENIKNGRKQQLIMLFLIMTISLGMYHATVARTILANAIDNTNYLYGVDLSLKEVWTYMPADDKGFAGGYIEPDISKYNAMTFAKSYTKVYNVACTYRSGNQKINTKVLGIHTKQFGEMTSVPKKLLSKHYYTYLNELAVEENGILCSSNFRDIEGYSIGDKITFSTASGLSMSGKIVDFFEYFPQYNPTSTVINPDGTVSTNQNYLIVTHFELMKSEWGTRPYEIWVDLKDGVTEREVYDFITDNDIALTQYSFLDSKIEETEEDPLLQGTNGVLTMGFVVTILLCAVGYLIYWIMSIKERELVFGVLRACGFHKKEIFHVILNEQLFSGFLSILAGIGIGKLISKLFVPILQQAYASRNQVLPMSLYYDANDMYRLYGVIGLVMLVSLIVLIALLFKMNVTKALKLGEE